MQLYNTIRSITYVPCDKIYNHKSNRQNIWPRRSCCYCSFISSSPVIFCINHFASFVDLFPELLRHIVNLLAQRPRQKSPNLKTFFVRENCLILIQIPLNMFPSAPGPVNIKTALVQRALHGVPEGVAYYSPGHIVAVILISDITRSIT